MQRPDGCWRPRWEVKLLSASNTSDASHRRAGRLRNRDHQPRCLAPRQTHSDLPSSGQRRCSPGPRNGFGAIGPHLVRLRATTRAMAQQLGAKCSPPPRAAPALGGGTAAARAVRERGLGAGVALRNRQARRREALGAISQRRRPGTERREATAGEIRW